ncbi:hypothetical protein KUCAC02_004144, partial [Chaenocephalus aceratus]
VRKHTHTRCQSHSNACRCLLASLDLSLLRGSEAVSSEASARSASLTGSMSEPGGSPSGERRSEAGTKTELCTALITKLPFPSQNHSGKRKSNPRLHRDPRAAIDAIASTSGESEVNFLALDPDPLT